MMPMQKSAVTEMSVSILSPSPRKDLVQKTFLHISKLRKTVLTNPLPRNFRKSALYFTIDAIPKRILEQWFDLFQGSAIFFRNRLLVPE